MKDKTLIVKKKNVWGNELIYPVCQDSIIFSYIAGTKTQTEQLKRIADALEEILRIIKKDMGIK